jgi:DNA-binding transcriptional LysR family regulator
MQMKRLEETLGRPVFVRDGRQNRLSADGERLLDYARRIVKLNDEVLTSFLRPELTGVVRLGTPDDYADRFLPEILGRFARTHPLVQVDVDCRTSSALAEGARRGDLDLALITCGSIVRDVEIVRREPLVWVTSMRHCAHEEEVLPLAVSHMGCDWRNMALEALERVGRPYRIAFSSPNSNAVNAAVLAGLAVGAVPDLVVRPGMRRLTEADGFPELGEFDIGLVRAPGKASSAAAALARHIADSLGVVGRPMLAA